MTALVEGIAKDKNGSTITGIAATFSIFNKDNHSILLGSELSSISTGQWLVNLPSNVAGDKVLAMYSFEGNYSGDTDIAGAKFITAIATSQLNDSPINGLSYSSTSYSGITYDNGKFKYVNGEITTFKIGDIILGSILMTNQTSINIIDLITGASDETNQTVINIGRFLQSCHTPGLSSLSESTPIEISENTRNTCVGKSIDFTVDESTFESNSTVSTVLASFGDSRVLQSRINAQRHIKQGIIGWTQFIGTVKPPTSPAIYENGFYISNNNILEVALGLTNFVPSGIRIYYVGSTTVTNIVLKDNTNQTVLEASGNYNSGDIIPLTVNIDIGEITKIIITLNEDSTKIYYFEFYGNNHSSIKIDYDIGYDAGEIQGHTDGYAGNSSDDSTSNTNIDYISGYETGYAIGYTQGGNDLTSYNTGYTAGDTQGYNDGYAGNSFDDSTSNTNTYYISGYEAGYVIGYTRGQNANSSQGMIVDQQIMIL